VKSIIQTLALLMSFDVSNSKTMYGRQPLTKGLLSMRWIERCPGALSQSIRVISIG
jgi:hypothetical protein